MHLPRPHRTPRTVRVRRAIRARRVLGALSTATALAPLLALTPTAPATAATAYTATLITATKSLPVATEHRTGYDRDLFHLWIDADHDGCDTRDEVLIAEAVTAPTIGTGCALSGGKWFSYYDRIYTADPSTFDIDHLVPLAEAWDSGAYTWTAATREAYANDLGDPRPLLAVTASANRSKSDQDPAEWLPTYSKCLYIRSWVATKIRWHLSVDATEKQALLTKAKACPKTTITITRATITTDTDPTPPTTSTGLVLSRIDYNPDGPDDDANLNQELVAITNPTTTGVNLDGWVLHDDANHATTLPTQTLAAGATVLIHSGTGTNTTTDVYARWGWVWNNSGSETATLVDPSGTIADTCSYTGGSAGTVIC